MVVLIAQYGREADPRKLGYWKVKHGEIWKTNFSTVLTVMKTLAVATAGVIKAGDI